ncbi:GyrI-like domain-containing protein [Dermacoccaceae bacterium W4C1]
MNLDLKKDHPDWYRPPRGRFVEVDLPPRDYLAIDGHGDPNTSDEYAAAVQALFTTGYTVRAAWKRRTGNTFVVGPLEGLWSSKDPSAFVAGDKSSWDWTMLLPLPLGAAGLTGPAALGADEVEAGIGAAAKKAPHLPVSAVRHLELREERCLQTLHVGSYDDEAPVLARLHDEVMPSLGVTWGGLHHEVYLSDPRRVAAERLRTILRQPIASAGPSAAGS